MNGWNELLEWLAAVPRENGTPELHQTTTWLVETLEASGLEPELFAFTATPYVLRLAGVIALVSGWLYWRLARRERFAAALAVAVIAPAALLAQLEFYRPVFGWIGAGTQHHVILRLPAEQPQRRLVFAAHYDTKTDVLDHVQRAPVDFLAAPIIPLMWLGALAGIAGRRRPRPGLRRLVGVAAWGAAAYGSLSFIALSAGALVPTRSPGALDDGASCAVLVRLAESLAERGPLASTKVEIWWLSAEEVGVQGSWVYAAERFSEPPEIPTAIVNLEGIGASAQHALIPKERFSLRALAPDPGLVEQLEAVERQRSGQPLGRLLVGGATDARSFLAHGVPALTLISEEPGELFPRGLHSGADDRSRVDVAALDASLAYLLAVVEDADAQGR